MEWISPLFTNRSYRYSAVECGRSLAWLGHRLPKPTTRVRIPATAPLKTVFSGLKFRLRSFGVHHNLFQSAIDAQGLAQPPSIVRTVIEAVDHDFSIRNCPGIVVSRVCQSHLRGVLKVSSKHHARMHVTEGLRYIDRRALAVRFVLCSPQSSRYGQVTFRSHLYVVADSLAYVWLRRYRLWLRLLRCRRGC